MKNIISLDEHFLLQENFNNFYNSLVEELVLESVNESVTNEEQNLLIEFLQSDYNSVVTFINEVKRGSTGFQRNALVRKIKLGIKNFIHNLRMKYRERKGKLTTEYKWRKLNAKTPEQKEKIDGWFKRLLAKLKSWFTKASKKAEQKQEFAPAV